MLASGRIWRRFAALAGPALALALAVSPAFATKKALFDNYHTETAGNADWEIDIDQPVPLPDQSGIGPGTLGTYWTGAISSWGVSLVKLGYTVMTNDDPLTYQDAGNPYDLSNYDVLIVDEPNTRFGTSEAAAILSFLADGGGLVGISDHYGSDRDHDGWDSPMIWNAFDPTHLLGVHFAVSGESNNNIVQTSTNVNAAASDSVTNGPAGMVTGLAFHNGTTMTLDAAMNPSVRGEVWMTGLPQTSTTGLMAASSIYGAGRVVFVTDSSPADDGSASPGNNSIYDGWGEAGATDSTLFLNATIWVTRRETVSAPPAVVAPVVTLAPNPFAAEATISYTLPHPGQVSLAIYDLGGRNVRQLVSGSQGAGAHASRWDGRAADGRKCAAGLYLFRLGTDAGNTTGKILLIE